MGRLGDDDDGGRLRMEEDGDDYRRTTTASTTTSTLTISTLRGPPELMSPAGGWPQLRAAVANGADAVYLGLTLYSARARAANFDLDPTLLWEGHDEDKDEDEEDPATGDLGKRLEMARSGDGGTRKTTRAREVV